MPYLDYTAGTISLTRGSKSVTGTKTYWLQKIHANDILKVMIPDQNTGQVVSNFYTVQQVVSDTQLYITNPYAGDTISNSNYAIQRLTEQSLQAELTTRQMKILDTITGLETALDDARENAAQSGISANAAKQYAAEAQNSMNKAIAAADRAETLEANCIRYRDEAKKSAQVATEQAGISTEQAGISTEQADIAIETVQTFLANANGPGGVPVIDETGKILHDLIPGTVQDIKTYPTVSDFPETGEKGYIYLALDELKTYLWSGQDGEVYVPIDTQVTLAGSGNAQTAARSDHNHDITYEPIHAEYVWSGVIDTPINIDTTFINDGNYIVIAKDSNIDTELITIQVEGKTYQLIALQLKTVSIQENNGQTSGIQMQTAYVKTQDFQYFTLHRIGIVIKPNNTSIFNVYGFADWKFQPSSDTIRVNGSKYHFVTKEQYNTGIADGSINTADVSFIEETADNISFAVRSINGIYPDGTGNVDISSLGTTTILANPDDYPLYRNANNIRLDGGQVMIVVGIYGSVENFPVEANSYFIKCFVAETIIYQECSALKSDGNIEKYARFGTTTTFSEWKLI